MVVSSPTLAPSQYPDICPPVLATVPRVWPSTLLTGHHAVCMDERTHGCSGGAPPPLETPRDGGAHAAAPSQSDAPPLSGPTGLADEGGGGRGGGGAAAEGRSWSIVATWCRKWPSTANRPVACDLTPSSWATGLGHRPQACAACWATSGTTWGRCSTTSPLLLALHLSLPPPPLLPPHPRPVRVWGRAVSGPRSGVGLRQGLPRPSLSRGGGAPLRASVGGSSTDGMMSCSQCQGPQVDKLLARRHTVSGFKEGARWAKKHHMQLRVHASPTKSIPITRKSDEPMLELLWKVTQGEVVKRQGTVTVVSCP